MKIQLVKGLEAGEVLAKNVYNHDGTLLLNAGYAITNQDINNLISRKIKVVYVEENQLEDITIDKYLDELKQSALQSTFIAFNSFVDGDMISGINALKVIEEMVDYIYDTASINTNLFEVKAYDNYTYIHCVDTAIMAAFLGRTLVLNRNEIKDLCVSAVLHDIGKTKIPERILNKVSPLSQRELFEIRRHPIFGKEILERVDMPDHIIEGVLQHHEKVNGRGYPYGLRGESISQFGKIISICDVFTAISAKRSYRDRFSPNEAYEHVLSNSGIAFDSFIIEKFRESFAIYPLGCCVKLSNDIEGYVVKQNRNFPDRPVIRVIYDHITKEQINAFEIDLLKYTNIVIDTVIS